MSTVTKRIKKLEPIHTKNFRELIVCLDTLRSKGIYNRFYAEWYRRASQAKGAHEELRYDYLSDRNGSIDLQAFIEDVRDAIKNCNAYIKVSEKFYADSPLEVYLDLASAAETLKTVFTTALSFVQ